MANEHYTHTRDTETDYLLNVRTGETIFPLSPFIFLLFFVHKETKSMHVCVRVRVQHAIWYQYQTYKQQLVYQKKTHQHEEKRRYEEEIRTRYAWILTAAFQRSHLF